MKKRNRFIPVRVQPENKVLLVNPTEGHFSREFVTQVMREWGSRTGDGEVAQRFTVGPLDWGRGCVSKPKLTMALCPGWSVPEGIVVSKGLSTVRKHCLMQSGRAMALGAAFIPPPVSSQRQEAKSEGSRGRGQGWEGTGSRDNTRGGTKSDRA